MTKQIADRIKIQSVSDRLRPVGKYAGLRRVSPKRAKAEGTRMGMGPYAKWETTIKQIADGIKIRSVGDGTRTGVGPRAKWEMTKQIVDRIKIRSVGDGTLTGVGPRAN